MRFKRAPFVLSRTICRRTSVSNSHGGALLVKRSNTRLCRSVFHEGVNSGRVHDVSLGALCSRNVRLLFLIAKAKNLVLRVTTIRFRTVRAAVGWPVSCQRWNVSSFGGVRGVLYRYVRFAYEVVVTGKSDLPNRNGNSKKPTVSSPPPGFVKLTKNDIRRFELYLSSSVNVDIRYLAI